MIPIFSFTDPNKLTYNVIFSEMDLHLLKLNKFCRLCKNILGIEEEKKKRNKVSVLEILKLQYPELEDFSFDNEDPNKFPGYICFSCHNKSSKWKADYSKHKNKMSRKPVSSREPFHSNREIVALNSVTSGFVCSRNSDCQVCSLVTLNPSEEVGPSPSKILRISEVAQVSPGDKIDPKKKKSKNPPKAGLASVKLDFQKGVRGPAGELIFQEPETVKVYTETKKSRSYSIDQCKERDQASLLSCRFCKRFSSTPVMSTVCNQIFCDSCFINFKSGLNTSICPGSASEACGKAVTLDHMEPLTGLLKNLHSSIHVCCSNSFCQESFPVSEIQAHVNSCLRRGSYSHASKLNDSRSFSAGLRVAKVLETFDQMCDDKKEDKIDVMFYKLVRDLKNSGNDLFKDVGKIYNKYSDGDHVSDEVDVEQTVALKSECNLTVGQYRACRKFSLQNKVGSGIFLPYKKVLKAEDELDCGNVEYDVFKNGEVVHHHEAVPNSSVIDVDSDIGYLSYEMLNPNIVGNRVTVTDSVCKELEELYPHLVRECTRLYPDLILSEKTLVVHTKLAFDGTKSALRSEKEASRLEIPNWFRGTICVLSVDIDDEHENLPLFKESNPNSGEANNIVLLWKSDENNLATISLAFSIYDKECDDMKENIYEVKVKSEPEHDLNQNAGAAIDENENDQPGFLKQKIKITVDKPKDEKLSRNAHNRAGAGSTFPCTYCSITRTDASKPPFSGRAEITLTNRLEQEVGNYITQNPSKQSQAKILSISLGQKGMPFTTAEPSDEPPDVLHEDINIVDPVSEIGGRIVHFGDQKYPNYTWIKRKDQKSELEESMKMYMGRMLKVCPTMPNITQMPGNFCREFCSEQNAQLILEPLPDCEAKTNYAILMDLWRTLRSIHKSSNPTEAEIDEYPDFVRRFLQHLDRKFEWFKPFPNQFHRLSHNFHFMVSKDNNPLGVKSLEGLEKGNFTTQVMDAHHTYKGNRKKANKGVFKLLRLKSSRLLRKYRRRPATRLQRCSRCHKVGHNASSKACQAALIQPGEHDGEAAALLGPAEGGDDDAGGLDAVPVEAGAAPIDMSDQEGMDVFDESQNIGEGVAASAGEGDNIEDIEDLLDGDDEADPGDFESETEYDLY